QIRFLLEASGGIQKIDAMVDQVVATMRATCPDAPDDVLKAHAARLKDEVLAGAIRLYEKYYSAEDIAALFEFFRSPLYRRIEAARPGLNRKTVAAGRELGTREGKEIREDLKKRGCNPGKAKSEPGSWGLTCGCSGLAHRLRLFASR